MNIELCINSSEVNRINKVISIGETLTGELRNPSNVVNPSILIQTSNPSKYNYAHIPEFERYYFIRDIQSVRNGLWQLDLSSDPLMSFKSQILQCQCILNETASTGSNNYLDGRNWVTNCKSKTDIISFSNGLLNDGEFILITAGG